LIRDIRDLRTSLLIDSLIITTTKFNGLAFYCVKVVSLRQPPPSLK